MLNFQILLGIHEGFDNLNANLLHNQTLVFTRLLPCDSHVRVHIYL